MTDNMARFDGVLIDVFDAELPSCGHSWEFHIIINTYVCTLCDEEITMEWFEDRIKVYRGY